MNFRRSLQHAHAGTAPPRWRRAVTAAAIVALGGTLGIAATRLTAQAALSTCSASVSPPCIFAGFEIDGDTAVNGGALDWQSATVTGSASYTTFTDPFNTTADNIMSNGSKESDQSSWSCVNSKPPSKSDIVNGSIWFQTLPANTGHQFIYGDFTRFGVNGDVHFDYEFNRATSTLSGSCSSLALRSKGDVLITFDTTNGGAIIFVSAFTWSCPTSGATSKVCTGAGSWVQSGGLVMGGTFEGTANLSPANSDPGVTAGAFGEASLDLTATVGNFACGEFGSAFMHSRSAGTSDIANGKAEIKDYVTPVPFNPGGCPNSGLSKAQRDHTTNPSGTFTQDTAASPLIVNPGDTLDYKLTYTNTGTGPATNVVVSDSIPAGTVYVASSCNLSCTPTGTNPVTSLSWSLGTQNGGASVDLTFQVTVNATGSAAGPVSIENFGTETATGETPPNSNHVFATVTYAPSSSLSKGQADVQPLNLYCNSASSGGATTSNTACASLQGAAVASPTFVTAAISATPGDVVEYQLTYTNSGNSPATTVVITDTVPSHSTYVAASAACDATCVVDDSTSTISWTYASVGVGVTKHVTFEVTLASSFAAGSSGSVSNTGHVITDQEASKASNTVVANVTATAALAIVKSSAVSGGQITYTISWFNTGNGNLTGQVISDTIPTGLKFVSCGGLPACSGGVVGSGGTVSWTVDAAAGTSSASPAGTVTLVLGT